MENLKLIETRELIDMLAQLTALYTKLFAARTRHEEFDECRKRITEIQNEIESRRKGREASRGPGS
jgi:hypothetical protein